MKTFEDYFPQILAGLWVITSITVILLSVITLKAKKVKWALDLERLKNFRYIAPGGKKREDWIQKIRLNHYEDYHKAFKGLYIAHVYEESKRMRKKYDVYIYIAGDKSKYFSKIIRADFMLGPFWNNHVITGEKAEGYFGIMTSTSESFLCTCCVILQDGRRLFMDRYIDFEMDRMIK